MLENKSERFALELMREQIVCARCEVDDFFPHRSEKNDKTAFLYLYQFSGKELTAAWLAHNATAKRDRKPTLQRLYKLMKCPPNKC